MVTAATADVHKKAVTSLTTLAIRDLVTVWSTLTLEDAQQAKREINDLLPLIMDGYGTPMASLSADWYDELRDAATLKTSYTAKVGTGPSAAELQSLAGWSIGPLFGSEPNTAQALGMLSGGLQRLLTNIDRETILENVADDPAGVRYARHASANACAFCALLATRGAVYLSRESSTTVVGRGAAKRNDGTRLDVKRKGIRARGPRGLGQGYHDHCHCVEVAIFPGQDFEEAPYVEKFREAYAASDSQNTTEILASMRQTLGSH